MDISGWLDFDYFVAGPETRRVEVREGSEQVSLA
jgi:hypothetical protein